MKIAFTADLHLDPLYLSTSYPFSSEKDICDNGYHKWEVLEEILQSCRQRKINHLVIAGDFLDKKPRNLPIENILKKFSDIQIHIIPGNHDSFLDDRYFSLGSLNLHIYTQPFIKEINNKYLIFLPYKEGSCVIEQFMKIKDHLNSDKEKIIVSHSEILDYEFKETYKEEKMYFPLTKKDVEFMNPCLIILGHIHQVPRGKLLYEKIIHTGSPCACNSQEQGSRYFLVIDLQQKISPHIVEFIKLQKGLVFYTKNLFVLPQKEEWEFVRFQLESFLKEMAKDLCSLESADALNSYTELKQRVCLTLNIKGISLLGKEKLELKIRDFLKDKIKHVEIAFEDLEVEENTQIYLLSEAIFKEVQNIPLYLKNISLPHRELFTSRDCLYRVILESLRLLK